MKKSTLDLFMLGFALVLAGATSQAMAMQKCGPVGGCNGGDRCNRNGLWIGDKSCGTNTSRPPVLPADKKARPQDNESVKSDIFDRWGKMKTKASCETGGGVWAGEDGKSSCTGPQKTQSQK